MRLAIAISVGAAIWMASLVRADEPPSSAFMQVSIRSQPVYIVPEKYGTEHKADFLGSLTEYVGKVDFWTPSPDNIIVAERTFREAIRAGMADPAQVFPQIAQHPENYTPDQIEAEKSELRLVDANYDGYVRQFVGIVVEGRKVIICNYTAGTSIDPASNYVFMQKTFEVNKGMRFLQGWYDPDLKTVLNVAMVGSWQPPPGK